MHRVKLLFSRRRTTHATGAALFISLVFLLILTIAGLAGVQNTFLEEKMAGNLREGNLAFQAAESALRAGEASLAAGIPLFVCDTADDGLYMNSSPGSDCPTSKGWPSNSQSTHPYSPDNENFWTGNGDVKKLWDTNDPLAKYDHLADRPKYVLEVLSTGATPPPATSLEAGVPVSPAPKLYRISAHGMGMSNSSAAVTQSVVRR